MPQSWRMCAHFTTSRHRTWKRIIWIKCNLPNNRLLYNWFPTESNTGLFFPLVSSSLIGLWQCIMSLTQGQWGQGCTVQIVWECNVPSGPDILEQKSRHSYLRAQYCALLCVIKWSIFINMYIILSEMCSGQAQTIRMNCNNSAVYIHVLLALFKCTFR